MEMNTKIGSMDEEVVADKEGKDLTIAFNPKYINDVLKVIDDEEVNLYLFNANAPCFIKNDEETYIYLILPVNMNWWMELTHRKEWMEIIMQEITIKDDYIKLGQALKLAGLVGSGVEAKMLIQDGLVMVNNEVEERRGRKLYADDIFSLDGEEVKVTALWLLKV